MMGINYINSGHKVAFKELIDQTYLTEDELIEGDLLLRRQLAFFYLISYYQEEYRLYEGMEFYVEVGEEMSLDGPTYLLDEAITCYDYPHEQALWYAKQILRGERDIIVLENDEILHKLVQQAVKIVEQGLAKRDESV